jgi:ornithine decarboxylase
VKEGDFVEIGLLGAYSNALRTRFNGFDTVSWATVMDEDIMRPAMIYSLERLRKAA